MNLRTKLHKGIFTYRKANNFPFTYRFKGSREISDGPKYEISSDGDRHSLVVKDVFGEDQDEYVVRAFNRGGNKTSRADLEISCKLSHHFGYFVNLSLSHTLSF